MNAPEAPLRAACVRGLLCVVALLFSMLDVNVTQAEQVVSSSYSLEIFVAESDAAPKKKIPCCRAAADCGDHFMALTRPEKIAYAGYRPAPAVEPLTGHGLSPSPPHRPPR